VKVEQFVAKIEEQIIRHSPASGTVPTSWAEIKKLKDLRPEGVRVVLDNHNDNDFKGEVRFLLVETATKSGAITTAAEIKSDPAHKFFPLSTSYVDEWLPFPKEWKIVPATDETLPRVVVIYSPSRKPVVGLDDAVKTLEVKTEWLYTHI